MKTRTEVLVGLAALAALLGVAALTSRPGPAPAVPDSRASTFVAGPAGAEGLLDAVQRLGIGTRRFRDRPTRLAALGDSAGRMFVILDPDPFHPLSAPEVAAIFRFSSHADLLLAGNGANPLIRCFGYEAKRFLFDSVRVVGTDDPAPRTDAALVETHQPIVMDTSRIADFAPVTCKVPTFVSTVTLLTSSRGPVAVRLERKDNGHSVLLFADAGLLRNATLRNSAAGPFILALFTGHDREVIFDEFHHGFGRSGSLTDAAVAWSRQSPWGWIVWQLVIVGALALLFGAVRFGPALAGISRRRRSSLEHVHALANALSAAHGHDQAIAALVRGLQRRLAPPAMRGRTDWREWLRQLVARNTAPDLSAPLATLESLTVPGQPAASVLRAADAVEELWQKLRP